jgi:Carbohydrate esterase, sialic acid-specific acetylesterase
MPLLLALLIQPCSAKTPLYLVALLGQSNMVGRGKLSDLPPGFPSNSTKLWNFTNAYKWEPAKEPIDSPLGQLDAVSLDQRAGVGPSLALANAFASAHPSIPIGLIPCAKGGSSILEWQEKPIAEPRNTLFGSCMNRMKMASQADGKIRAVVFWQGGRDAKSLDHALLWKDSFTRLVADLRADLGNPNLPVIMVMREDGPKAQNKYPYWTVVRDQQRSVNIPGVVKITSDGYERKSDGIHLTTKGQLAIGAALAALLPTP